jgi:hypothetical protein
MTLRALSIHQSLTADAALSRGGALCVGAVGVTATRQRLFGAGRGEATDVFDDAQGPGPASMLITGGLGRALPADPMLTKNLPPQIDPGLTPG